jgi:hypothetical protein
VPASLNIRVRQQYPWRRRHSQVDGVEREAITL